MLVGLCVGAGTVVRLPGSTLWQPLDDWWAQHAIGSLPLTSLSELAALGLAALVGPVGWVLLAALALVLAVRGRLRHAAVLVLAPLLASFVTTVLKHWVDRARPEEMLVALTSYSYPSGHSSQAAAFAVAALLVLAPATRRRWWPLAALGVLAMMWSRTHLAVHWLSDTLGGAMLGAGLALLLSWVVWPWLIAPGHGEGPRLPS